MYSPWSMCAVYWYLIFICCESIRCFSPLLLCPYNHPVCPIPPRIPYQAEGLGDFGGSDEGGFYPSYTAILYCNFLSWSERSNKRLVQLLVQEMTSRLEFHLCTPEKDKHRTFPSF